MTRPVVASIDLLALRQNLQIVRRAAPGSRPQHLHGAHN